MSSVSDSIERSTTTSVEINTVPIEINYHAGASRGKRAWRRYASLVRLRRGRSPGHSATGRIGGALSNPPVGCIYS
jgi:hypothetical protein